MPIIYSKDVKGVSMSAAELAQHVCFIGTTPEVEAWLSEQDRADFVVDYETECVLPAPQRMLRIYVQWDATLEDANRTFVLATRLPDDHLPAGSMPSETAITLLRWTLSEETCELMHLCEESTYVMAAFSPLEELVEC